MNAPHPLEVADVLRSYGAEYLASNGRSVSGGQLRILKDLPRCRTAALGGHTMACDRCGHQEVAYNSCRNRHCPKCQARARAEWLEARAADLLDVEYFHVVLTLPTEIAPLAIQNRRLLYGMLFRSAAETLLTIARDPKHLGAHIGFLAVLHTWSQALHHHPHLHCVVPGGGVSLDGDRWVSCRSGFFLPVRVLSRLFRGKFLAALNLAYRQQELSLAGELEPMRELEAWKRFIEALRRTEWVVYSKPPFGGPEQVLKYLARYTHRVAISNQRLVDLRDDQVTFRVKDRARGNRKRTITVSAAEFVRRFLLHTLPKGFVRIRHYGFLANCVRQQRLTLARKLLDELDVHDHRTGMPSERRSNVASSADRSNLRCPACKKGRMIIVETLDPPRMAPIAHNRSPPEFALGSV